MDENIHYQMKLYDQAVILSSQGDYAKALRLFQEAAEQNCIPAILKLAQLSEMSFQTLDDIKAGEEALKYYRQGADLGNKEAKEFYDKLLKQVEEIKRKSQDGKPEYKSPY